SNSGSFSVSVTTAALGPVAPAGPLVSAVLPSSRSVQVGKVASAFGTLINAGANPAVACGIAPGASLPATFSYQRTDPATNAVVGTQGTPAACIPPGGSQSYVIAFTPPAAFAPIDVPLTFQCGNSAPAASVPGLNTLLLTAAAAPVPDIIALAATIGHDGIVNIAGVPGAGAFAVATAN